MLIPCITFSTTFETLTHTNIFLILLMCDVQYQSINTFTLCSITGTGNRWRWCVLQPWRCAVWRCRTRCVLQWFGRAWRNPCVICIPIWNTIPKMNWRSNVSAVLHVLACWTFSNHKHQKNQAWVTLGSVLMQTYLIFLKFRWPLHYHLELFFVEQVWPWHCPIWPEMQKHNRPSSLG